MSFHAYQDEMEHICVALIGNSGDLYLRSPDFHAWVKNQAAMALASRDALIPVFEAADHDYEERLEMVKTATLPSILLCAECPRIEGFPT